MIGELFDQQESIAGRKLLNELLIEYLGEIPCNGADSFSQHPVVVKPYYLPQMERLCRVLNEALTHVVGAYFKNEDIRNIYQLDEELENILRAAADRKYEVGLYRPDFLQALDGQAKICEIGARYPINGWMISYYLNIISNKQPAIPAMELQAVPQQTAFLDTIYQRFETETPIVLLHDNEKGTEVFYLLREFSERGLNSVSATPQDLKVQNGKVTLHGQAVHQFIFEMDREELRKFSPDVLKLIVTKGNYFNDVRTLILVHDKRILAVLYDALIMEKYLSAEDHKFLRSYLIPTYSLNTPEKRTEIIQSGKNWLLKQNSGGRGIGIYVKTECPAETWTKVIQEQWQDYMVQQHVEQQLFDYHGHSAPNRINLVGMLLCYNGQSFGPGLFRGSAESVVNVHQGRGVIFPPMISKS